MVRYNDPVDPRHSEAFNLLKDGKHQEALPLLEAILKDDLADAAVLETLGDVREKLGDPHGALSAYAGAVVHLHSTHSVAVSCLDAIDPGDVLPPITAYYVMRVGKLPLIPYYAPGDPTLGEAVGRVAARHSAVLLANHGPVVAGSSLSAAVNAIEELEETARLYLLLHGRPTRYLTPEQVADLRKRFPIP